MLRSLRTALDPQAHLARLPVVEGERIEALENRIAEMQRELEALRSGADD